MGYRTASTLLIGLAVLLAIGLAGCRHCSATTLTPPAYHHPPPCPREQDGNGRAAWLVLWMGGLAGVVWLARGGVRWAEAGNNRISLEREEVALLRTAREAMVLLVKSVRKHRTGRPPDQPPGGV